MTPDRLWHYKGRVMKVVDGDTIEVAIELGFDLVFTTRVRVAGVNTPEIHSKDLAEKVKAEEARLTVVHWVAAHPEVYLRTIKTKEKYGRYLAEVFSPDGESLGQMLLDKGLAVPLSYA
jgi:micrococcal nuclease